MRQDNYTHTLYASYTGYVVQAVVNNFIPLLFLTLRREYALSLEQIAFFVTLNFGVQLVVDLLAASFVDKIGYRPCIVAAHVLSAVGLGGLAFLPDIFPVPYVGMLLCVVLYAIGGGLIEVLISPIVDACPSDEKAAGMSLLHSFYCWGCVFAILVSTLFFVCFSTARWRVLACLWSLLPLANAIYFTRVPIPPIPEAEKGGAPVKALLSSGLFWVFVLLMVCAGASEQAMSQWASAFAEAGLGVSKTVGDLAGPCLFAVLMGISRIFYAKCSEKLPLRVFMIGSGLLCVAAYLLASLSKAPLPGLLGCALCGFSVGIFWPGTLSLASANCPGRGTAMFAFLALAGDLGCSAGPTLVGVAAENLGGSIPLGILCAIVFPAILVLVLLLNAASLQRKDG